jgi:cellobiose-specific phosphotransferase system component IIC
VHVFGLESVLSRSAQIVGGGAGGVLLTLSILRVNWAIGLAGVAIVAAAVWGMRVLFARSEQAAPEEEEAPVATQ